MITGGCCHDYPKQKNIISEGISERVPTKWDIFFEMDQEKSKAKLSESGWAEGYDYIVYNHCFAHEKDAYFVKSITDKAEVSIDFPDKAYWGAFGRASRFEAHADDEGVVIKLERDGEDKRRAGLHLHYYLFADILNEIADSLEARPQLDEAHRDSLVAAAKKLTHALRKNR